MRPGPPWVRAGLMLVGVSIASRAQAAPITFLTALPVAQGKYVWREQLLWRRDTRDPTPMQRAMQAWGVGTAFAYGATPKFTVFVAAPLMDKRLDLTLPTGMRITRRARGLGDAMAFGRYTFLHRDGAGYTLRGAWFVGAQMPTGRDHASDAFGRLPPPLQLGTGAWDPLTGVTFTYQTLDYEFDMDASELVSTEAQGYRSGDLAELDASLQVRLLPRQLGAGLPHFLYGVLEANLLEQGHDRQQGVIDPNSGGTTLFLSPGLQVVTPDWIWEASVQVPVAQHLHGSAVKNNFILWAGFQRNFGA